MERLLQNECEGNFSLAQLCTIDANSETKAP